MLLCGLGTLASAAEPDETTPFPGSEAEVILVGVGSPRDLSGGDLSPRMMAGRDAIHRLRELGADLTFDAVGNVASVRLSGFRFTDDDLQLLVPLRKLQRLEIVDTRITDDGLKHLRRLAALESLSLSRLEIHGGGLASLGEVEGLASVSLWRTCVDDRNFRHLLRAPRLADLSISRNSMTDDSLAALREFRALKTLFVFGPEFTDDGLRELAGLSQLQRLSLIRNPSMTVAAVEELRQALPQTELEVRGPAFLGVAAQPHPLGCRVVGLQPGGAAATAGLKTGDVMTSFDGLPVPDFGALIEAVNQRLPGDEIRVGYLRQGKPGELTIVLHAWE